MSEIPQRKYKMSGLPMVAAPLCVRPWLDSVDGCVLVSRKAVVDWPPAATGCNSVPSTITHTFHLFRNSEHVGVVDIVTDVEGNVIDGGLNG